eukprot:5577952-Alexandrium_andersonii.AAC.1
MSASLVGSEMCIRDRVSCCEKGRTWRAACESGLPRKLKRTSTRAKNWAKLTSGPSGLGAGSGGSWRGRRGRSRGARRCGRGSSARRRRRGRGGG